ncbi:MAG TPA: hypothetical protein VFO82_10235 [Steroidobacteraceae bacterium]|nr:hypothetical protein [Steroidobacteraceae bacterium]
MSKVSVSIGPESIALASDRVARAVHAQGWLTRHGVLLCHADDVPLEAGLSAEILSVESLLQGAAWQLPDSPPAQARTAALECSAWPRALRWATALRCLADADGIEVETAELKLGVAGDEVILDACRAASLLGWPLSGIVGEALPPVAAVMSRWSERRPWCELRGSDQRVLISDSTDLPARARFGRRFMDPDETAPVPETDCEFSMAGESLQVSGGTDTELRGTHEYEVAWRTNGSLTLELIVDGDWSPLPVVPFPAWSSAANREAAALYGALSYWHAVMEAAQVNLIDPLHRKED